MGNKRLFVIVSRDLGEYRVSERYAESENEITRDVDSTRIGVLPLGVVVETKRRCQSCHKPFRVGDKVYHMHRLAEDEVISVESDQSVRLRKYGQDGVKSIVHMSDIPAEVVAEFRSGQGLWSQGMEICSSIQEQFFAEAYKQG